MQQNETFVEDISKQFSCLRWDEASFSKLCMVLPAKEEWVSDSRNSNAFAQRKCLLQIWTFLGLQKGKEKNCLLNVFQEIISLQLCGSMKWDRVAFKSLIMINICFLSMKKAYRLQIDIQVFLFPFPMLSTSSSVVKESRSLNHQVGSG